MITVNILTNFQLLYQKIYDIYHSESTDTEKWLLIATQLNDRHQELVELFQNIYKNDARSNINLDYDIDMEQLQKQITLESDNLYKIALIITAMHHIIYELMKTNGNYYFSLFGPDEMHILKRDITYYISISEKREQNIFFHTFILIFALESLFNKRLYVGIDFEYNNKKIQLAQLNFEHNIDLGSMIIIVSPNELEPDMMKNFVNLIICNPQIKKILHGSDSLDVPYMYEHMLNSDPDKIIAFTKTLIDTRFLCEYYKLNKETVTDNKCSIYDEEAERSAIFYFGVVSQQQQAKLTELMQSLPPPQDIIWNIHKMPKSRLLYAQYDVLFLKYFYYRMINVATQEEETDLGKKAIIELYKHVLYELTQFVYLERRDITFVMKKCKTEVDPVNNYMIRKPNTIMKLIDVFNQISIGLTTVNPKTDIDKLMRVNYYKSLIVTIIKRMVYGILSKTCKIYKDKTTIWTDKLDNQFVFEFLHEMGFLYLERMFREIQTTLEGRVKLMCN